MDKPHIVIVALDANDLLVLSSDYRRARFAGDHPIAWGGWNGSDEATYEQVCEGLRSQGFTQYRVLDDDTETLIDAIFKIAEQG